MTDAQISAAHAAWENVLSQWQLREVRNPVYGAPNLWLVENRPSPRFEPERDYANEIAYHKFEGADAERKARFLLRDKCLRAALAAATKS